MNRAGATKPMLYSVARWRVMSALGEVIGQLGSVMRAKEARTRS